MSQEQLAKYQRDKQYNYREYVIRVAGFCFAESDDGIYDYFLRKYIYDENGRLIDRCFANNKKIYQQAINNNRITAISFGFDAGKHDDASVVCCLLTDKNYCIVYDYIKRLQQSTDNKNQIRELVNQRLIFFIKHCLKGLGITTHTKLKYTNNKICIFTDNDLIVEILNKKFKEQNLNNWICLMANRKDCQRGSFSIESRQHFWDYVLSENLFYVRALASQILTVLGNMVKYVGETKRDEKIHADEINVLNALEYACSDVIQLAMTNMNTERRYYGHR